MAQISFDNPDCRGVEYERPDGSRALYRRPEKGAPVVEVPERHARAMANTPGTSRYTKSYTAGANFRNGLRVWEE